MKYYHYEGQTWTDIPDPFNGVSPMRDKDGHPLDDRFRALGGNITEDEALSPEQKFRYNLGVYLAGLEGEARQKGIHLTVADFLTAASTMFSTDLIQWARDHGVPDEMIAEVRNQILVYIADASRLGLTWNDIFTPTAE